MASRPGRDDVIECHAVKADSPFIALRLMEAYESILRAFDVKGYVFTMSKDNPDFLSLVMRLPETVKYSESDHHVYGMRMLSDERWKQSPGTYSH